MCVMLTAAAMMVVLLSQEIALHIRTINAYLREYQEEYTREGVLIEAVTLLEEKGEGFVVANLPSSFAPSYAFTITSDTITLTKNGEVVLQAGIRWEGKELSVVYAENNFIRPFSR
uniref:Type II secretion system protein n=2 Tax=Candidatus Caldatribacterium saccharofermentans TaxID=1454753 RepID=A0A7V4TVU8_9BACT